MQYRKAHFIGISGKGMSATALLLRQSGTEISGSDEGFYPPVSDYLRAALIPFKEGYKPENIPSDADVIVIGKNAKLTPETNSEVRTAFASGIPVKSFPDILEELTAGKETIVVAGSYGKSTCTALLSWCLKESGKDPSYFIGEVTKGFESYAHLGAGNVFVLEGDEYPSSNWDHKSKFLHYNAKNVLLTSATHDHINIYPTHKEYLKPFTKLLDSLSPKGLLVVSSDEPHAKALSEKSPATKIFYSIEGSQSWHAANIRYSVETSFELMRGAEKVATLSTSLLGRHNIENIVGISAMLLEKKLITPEDLKGGVASFKGVRRRMDLLSPLSAVPVYEGFGSSYEKAKSAIAAAKLHFPDRRLLVLFEPHTFTWRNRASLIQYRNVFSGAQKVYIYEPASQGASAHEQLTQEEIVECIRANGFDVTAVHTPEETLVLFEQELLPADVILILTSGSFDGLIESIPKLAEKKFPK